MQARDIMTSKVIAVSPDTSVLDVANLLIQNRISAVPVVDGAGKVLGIVSEGDLMRRPEAGTEPHHSWWLRAFEVPEEHMAEYAKAHGSTAGDVMTSPAVTVPETASVAEIAEILEKRHIKRVPVVAGDKLVGLVSRANLVQALAAHRGIEPLAKGDDDRKLRKRIIDAIDKDVRITVPFISVIVKDGKVELWGGVGSDAEKKAIRIAAENIAGKGTVTDHVGVLSPSTRAVLWGE